MRIVFMGTPEFAAASLEQLLTTGTRSWVCSPSRISQRAEATSWYRRRSRSWHWRIRSVFQPQKMRDGQALEILQQLQPELIAVVAYGKLLPKEILELPKYGCINVHGSLLPKYRGAGPIQWSIIDGEKTTGVTTMYMGEGLDTGDMILKKETPIGEETYGGCTTVWQSSVRRRWWKGRPARAGQGAARKTGRRSFLLCADAGQKIAKLDFAQPATKLHDLIRGLSPWPVAHTTFEGKLLKVHRAVVAQAQGDCGPAGKVLDSKKLIVACGSGALELQQVQLEGGKRISGEDFMRGRKRSSWASNLLKRYILFITDSNLSHIMEEWSSLCFFKGENMRIIEERNRPCFITILTVTIGF